MVVFSYNVNRVFAVLGLRRTYLTSQIFGLVAVGILYWGFSQLSYLIIVAGLLLAGLPGNLVSVGIISIIKQQTSDAAQFRKYSATREVILGTSQIIAGISVPFLIPSIGVSGILVLDALSYITAFIYISRVLTESSIPRDLGTIPPFPNFHYIFRPRFKEFAFIAASPLLLLAFLPMMAGSDNFSSILSLPDSVRRSLWAIEGFTMALSGSAYFLMKKWFDYSSFLALFLLNGLWVTTLNLPHTTTVSIGVCIVIAFSFNFCFVRLRDDLLIASGHDKASITAYSGLALAFRSAMATISPFLLAWIFGYLSFPRACVALLLGQGTLVVCGVLIARTHLRPGLTA